MQTNAEFGNHFRLLRKAQGLSQQKFADVVDISYRHLNFLENNRAKPSRETVLKITSALGLSLKNSNCIPILQKREVRNDGLAVSFWKCIMQRFHGIRAAQFGS